MKKILLFLGLVSILSLGLVASNSYAAGTTGRSGFMMFDGSNLVGAPVKDSQGKMTGFVDEVRVDSEGHAFAVIYHADYDPFEYGGGMNTPVPIQELTIPKATVGQETVAVKTDEKHLDLAPYLDPLKMQSRRYEGKIYEYYGIHPYWTLRGTAEENRFMELDSRDLIGAAVANSCGKVVGIVNEVMVDTQGHAFAIVNHGDYDLYGDGGVNTPVPFQELTISKTERGQSVVLKTDMEHLDLAPYLDPLKMQSRRYEANIYEYYGIQPSWTEGRHKAALDLYRWGAEAQDF